MKCSFCNEPIKTYTEGFPFHDTDNDIYYHSQCYDFINWCKANRDKVLELLKDKEEL